jgi:hypothetical protein
MNLSRRKFSIGRRVLLPRRRAAPLHAHDSPDPHVVRFGLEDVDRRETRLPCDAVPEVNCQANVAGP